MKFKIIIITVLIFVLNGCQANCEVQTYSDDDYLKLQDEYNELQQKLIITEAERNSFKSSKEHWENKQKEEAKPEEKSLSDYYQDVYSYSKDNKIHYISSIFGIEFTLDKELPENFSVKEHKDHLYFGIFYQDNDNLEPVHIFMVQTKEVIANDEMQPQIYHEFENGLCVAKSYAHFNASNISHDVWKNIINPYIDSLNIQFN